MFLIQESRDLNEGYYLTIVKAGQYDQDVTTLVELTINEPLKFRDSCSENNSNTYIFYGSEGELFWFSRAGTKCLTLNLLEADSTKPQLIMIQKDTELQRHVLEDRYFKAKNQAHYYYATAVPRLVTIGSQRLVVFSQHVKDNPSVFFFDLETGAEIVRVQGAEMFLHSLGQHPESEDEYQILFRADPVLCLYLNELHSLKIEQRIEKFSDLISQRGPGYQTMKLIKINFAEAQKRGETILYDVNDEAL